MLEKERKKKSSQPTRKDHSKSEKYSALEVYKGDALDRPPRSIPETLLTGPQGLYKRCPQ
ncbi:hypothetical protein CR513_21555, partial [Mucuna pruriens]